MLPSEARPPAQQSTLPRHVLPPPCAPKLQTRAGRGRASPGPPLGRRVLPTAEAPRLKRFGCPRGLWAAQVGRSEEVDRWREGSRHRDARATCHRGVMMHHGVPQKRD